LGEGRELRSLALPQNIMPCIAAVDIGSLTVRLAVAEVIGPGSFQVILHHREITGLGRGLGETGMLDPAARENTLGALREFAREMAAHGVMRGQGVATQAVRQAHNGKEFLQAAEEVLRIPVRLLASEEEALLTVRGVLSALAPKYLDAGPLLVFDVGGGSSEFVLMRPTETPVLAGLPLGVLSVSQTRPLGDPPQPQKVEDLKRELRRALQNFYQPRFGVLLEKPPILVGTAGSVTTLAAVAQDMTEYDPQRINNYILSKEEVAELATLLAALPESERARLPGIEPAKAGVMVAGALIVQTILEVCGQDRLIAIDSGLLEGVLAEVAEG
jgi:exopolyphosphatase/guanosine-5'-triphosphate,3'-diphosphate pyrophosphatase